MKMISESRMETNVKNATNSFLKCENLSEIHNIFVIEFGNFWIDQF